MELADHATMMEHGVAVDSSGAVRSEHGKKKTPTGRSWPSTREKGEEGHGVACAGLGHRVRKRKPGLRGN